MELSEDKLLCCFSITILAHVFNEVRKQPNNLVERIVILPAFFAYNFSVYITSIAE